MLVKTSGCKASRTHSVHMVILTSTIGDIHAMAKVLRGVNTTSDGLDTKKKPVILKLVILFVITFLNRLITTAVVGEDDWRTGSATQPILGLEHPDFINVQKIQVFLSFLILSLKHNISNSSYEVYNCTRGRFSDAKAKTLNLALRSAPSVNLSRICRLQTTVSYFTDWNGPEFYSSGWNELDMEIVLSVVQTPFSIDAWFHRLLNW